jgi:hypothetical protein
MVARTADTAHAAPALAAHAPIGHSRDMGFLKNLKDQVAAAQAAGNAMAGAEPIPEMPVFINPRPQDEVDRLAQGTGPIRAIVLGKRHQALEQGERIGKMRVHVRLRPRGPEGTLGDETTVKAWMSTDLAALLSPGLDIPVERDPATGAITELALAQLKQELAERLDAAAKRPAFGLDPDVEGMIDVAKAVGKAVKGDPKAAAPGEVPASASDPRRQPVEGLTWETYVAICAHLEVSNAPNGADVEARQFGVKPYTWLAVSSVWKNRIAADPGLTQLFERDLEEARGAL